jgi:hypothetical protein
MSSPCRNLILFLPKVSKISVSRPSNLATTQITEIKKGQSREYIERTSKIVTYNEKYATKIMPDQMSETHLQSTSSKITMCWTGFFQLTMIHQHAFCNTEKKIFLG